MPFSPPTSSDITGLIASYVYAFALLLIMEAIGKRLKWPQHFTRKIIHIGAGMWVWGILYFFDHWYLGIIPFSTFIVLNYIFYRQQTFKAMDDTEATLGTVYFAISITILFALMWRTDAAWDYAPVATAAVIAMTWGDAAASIIGKRWGKHTYTTFGHTRSWEGSIAMAVFSFLGIALTLFALTGSTLSPNSVPAAQLNISALACIGSIIATAAESLSPTGTDNLSVPLLTGLALFLLVQV